MPNWNKWHVKGQENVWQTLAMQKLCKQIILSHHISYKAFTMVSKYLTDAKLLVECGTILKYLGVRTRGIPEL